MRKYKFERKYIDMKGFRYYITKRWISIVAIVLAMCILGTGISLVNQIRNKREVEAKYPDGKKTVTLSIGPVRAAELQQYAEDSINAKKYREYNENSLYMKLDPEQVYKRTIRYSLTRTDGGTCHLTTMGIANSGQGDELFTSIAEQLQIDTSRISEIRELVTIETNTAQQIGITVYGATEDQAIVIGDAINKYLQEVAFPTHTGNSDLYTFIKVYDENVLVRDTVIRDKQQANIAFEAGCGTRMENKIETLSDKEKEYINKYLEKVEKGDELAFGDEIKSSKKVSIPSVSIKNAIFAGAKYGLLALLAVIFLWLICYVFTPFVWSGKAVEDSFGLKYIGKSGEEVVDYYLNQEISNMDKLLVISQSTKEFDECTVASSKDLISKKYNLNNFDAIVLADITGKVKYSQIEDALKLTEKYEDKIKGFIVVDRKNK